MKIEDTLKIFQLHKEEFVSTFNNKTSDIILPLVPESAFSNSDSFEKSITPQGVKDKSVLKNAPKADITVAGEKKKAKGRRLL